MDSTEKKLFHGSQNCDLSALKIFLVVMDFQSNKIQFVCIYGQVQSHAIFKRVTMLLIKQHAWKLSNHSQNSGLLHHH